jgi:hypothetical protein
LSNKHWNDLEDQRDHHKEEDQDAVHLILKTLLCVVGHEKRESDYKRLRPVLAFELICVSRGIRVLTAPIDNNALELI